MEARLKGAFEELDKLKASLVQTDNVQSTVVKPKNPPLRIDTSPIKSSIQSKVKAKSPSKVRFIVDSKIQEPISLPKTLEDTWNEIVKRLGNQTRMSDSHHDEI